MSIRISFESKDISVNHITTRKIKVFGSRVRVRKPVLSRGYVIGY
jgi:hypothetical protein